MLGMNLNGHCHLRVRRGFAILRGEIRCMMAMGILMRSRYYLNRSMVCVSAANKIYTCFSELKTHPRYPQAEP